MPLASRGLSRGFPDRIVVLPEAFVPCYPASAVFGPVFGGFFDKAAGPAFLRLVANSIEVPGPETEAIAADLYMGEIAQGRQLLDVAGHYSRPDVFRLVTPEPLD